MFTVTLVDCPSSPADCAHAERLFSESLIQQFGTPAAVADAFRAYMNAGSTDDYELSLADKDIIWTWVWATEHAQEDALSGAANMTDTGRGHFEVHTCD